MPNENKLPSASFKTTVPNWTKTRSAPKAPIDLAKVRAALESPATSIEQVHPSPVRPALMPLEKVVERAADIAIARAEALAQAEAMFNDVPQPLNLGPVPAAPIPVPALSAAVPVAPAAPVAPVRKLPSLRNFCQNAEEFNAEIWPNELIHECLAHEGWRERQPEEVIAEGDILHFAAVAPEPERFEKVECFKGEPVSEDLLNKHAMRVLVSGGSGKRKAFEFKKVTSDYPQGMFSVPKGMQLRLPKDMKEAQRFFGLSEYELMPIETMESGRKVTSYCPMLSKMSDKRFRVTFSRIFVEFAKKYLKRHIQELIPGRGQGLVNKRGVSPKVPPVKQVSPPPPFLEKIKARSLKPQEWSYDRAIGVEIETVCPISLEKAQEFLQNEKVWFVQCAVDNSIRVDAPGGNRPDNRQSHGVEFRLLLKRSELEERLQRALQAINKMGCKVNQSCGLHVHFDMRYRGPVLKEGASPAEKAADQTARDLHEASVDKTIDRLWKWLKELREILPESRRANNYCTFEPNSGGNRHYDGVSKEAYKRHQTIEVRFHSATTDYNKIINWIRLNEHLMTLKYAPIASMGTIETLKRIALPEAEKDYWFKRHHQLNPKLYSVTTKADTSFLLRPTEVE